jgi:hypothetical protein
MKRMTKAEALEGGQVSGLEGRRKGVEECSHGQGAEDDEKHGKGEDGGDAGCQADDHGQDAKPGREVSEWSMGFLVVMFDD